MTQVMSDLPSRRLDITETPFTHTGIDVFGPFYVKYKRSQIKRYGIIFTCLVMRAVHIEMGADLSVDSFINALRRFLARRGRVSSLSCDNGTNFRGASTELAKAVDSWNCGQTHHFLNNYCIEWHFNPPYSSHFGGVWERLIRSIRSILTITMKEQILNEDQLSTLFCEAEAIINGRPLTSLSDDPNDLTALTPSHLLTLKPGLTEFVETNKTDCFSKRKWRQVQFIANLFWNRFKTEYISSLQIRQKWIKEQKDLEINDIVLIVDEKLPRGHWPLGRITEIISDSDNHVRRVKILSKSGIIERPYSKLIFLLNN